MMTSCNIENYIRFRERLKLHESRFVIQNGWQDKYDYKCSLDVYDMKANIRWWYLSSTFNDQLLTTPGEKINQMKPKYNKMLRLPFNERIENSANSITFNWNL